MSKIRSILPFALCTIRTGLRFCSKVTPEPVINLPDALGAKVDESAVKAANNALERNMLHPEKSLVVIDIDQMRNISSANISKKTKGCIKKGANKVKKVKSSGNPKPQPPKKKKKGPQGGYGIDEKCNVYEFHRSNSSKWKTISYCLIPCVIGFAAFVFATVEEKPEPDYIPYEYMYKRSKRFPWGDGKRTFFHGPYNLIPDEEEERIDRDGPGEGPRYKKKISKAEEDEIERLKRLAKNEIDKLAQAEEEKPE